MHRIFQLPDVAGPVVLFQLAVRLGAEILFHSVFPAVTLYKILGEAINVLLPLAQRRYLDHADIQPVKKVFPELTLVHQLAKGYVVCANHSHIDVSRGGSPHPIKGVFLKHPQKLRLHGKGQRPDFVQKQGPVVCHLEIALLARCRSSGKRAFLIAEKFRLCKAFLYGGAVYLDTRLGTAGTVLVNEVKNSLLAHSCFSLNNHVAVVFCYIQGVRYHFLRHRAHIKEAVDLPCRGFVGLPAGFGALIHFLAAVHKIIVQLCKYRFCVSHQRKHHVVSVFVHAVKGVLHDSYLSQAFRNEKRLGIVIVDVGMADESPVPHHKSRHAFAVSYILQVYDHVHEIIFLFTKQTLRYADGIAH